MTELKAGEYFGSHYFDYNHKGLLVSDMEYTHRKVDWHRHENPYFTFLLAGDLMEENKKESYFLKPGALVYHNWQDVHRNKKPDRFTRGFHLELKKEWLSKVDISCPETMGKRLIEDPEVKKLMFLLVTECKSWAPGWEVSLDMLTLSILSHLNGNVAREQKNKPDWVPRLNEWLLEETDSPRTASELARMLDLHPVYLSRIFHDHFGMSYSRYVRLLRLSRANSLMLASGMSLTEIAYTSGYFDQSHFIRDFKREFQTTPKSFHRVLQG